MLKTSSLVYRISNKSPVLITILQLLKKNPSERLGYKGVEEIKAHKWFSNLDWQALSERRVRSFN